MREKKLAPPAIPDQLVGIWQRMSLQSEGEPADTSTRVIWLQTRRWHADIRIPANRPVFRGKRSLQDFSARELLALTAQQGFAGITTLNDDVCHWQRIIDFQPQRETRDIAHVNFIAPNSLIEDGIDAVYREEWRRIGDGDGRFLVLELLEQSPLPPRVAARRSYLVVVGDAFIFARDRGITLPRAPSLISLMESGALAQTQLPDALDLEISLGRVSSGVVPWEIKLSTLPFREGKSLFRATSFNLEHGLLVQRPRGGAAPVSHWAIRESSLEDVTTLWKEHYRPRA